MIHKTPPLVVNDPVTPATGYILLVIGRLLKNLAKFKDGSPVQAGDLLIKIGTKLIRPAQG